ncbi:MAG: tRNA (cytidine(34)-2'-O)-methyltransferase [bacterium]
MCDMLPLHIVLVQPEIPHNTGAIGRVCVGIDCALHLIRPLGFHLDAHHLKRAGMDYWQHVHLSIHDTWDAFLEDVKPAHIFFLSTRGEKSLYTCSFNPNDALVFGNESSGLPEPFYEHYRETLFKIPMPGVHARSINLANAVSITAYEAYRQLNSK